MKTTLLLASAASAMLFASSALSQAPAQGQASSPSDQSPAAGAPAPSVSGAAQSDFTDEQLRTFAGVALELQKAGNQDPASMAAAVQKSGLTVDQFNRIAAQMRSDPAFNTRVQQLAQSAAGQGAASGPASAPESTTSTGTAPTPPAEAPPASTSEQAPRTGGDPAGSGR